MHLATKIGLSTLGVGVATAVAMPLSSMAWDAVLPESVDEGNFALATTGAVALGGGALAGAAFRLAGAKAGPVWGGVAGLGLGALAGAGAFAGWLTLLGG